MHRAEQSAIVICLTYTIFNTNVLKNVLLIIAPTCGLNSWLSSGGKYFFFMCVAYMSTYFVEILCI